jgi:hypothetical protein
MNTPDQPISQRLEQLDTPSTEDTSPQPVRARVRVTGPRPPARPEKIDATAPLPSVDHDQTIVPLMGTVDYDQTIAPIMGRVDHDQTIAPIMGRVDHDQTIAPIMGRVDYQKSVVPILGRIDRDQRRTPPRGRRPS